MDSQVYACSAFTEYHMNLARMMTRANTKMKQNMQRNNPNIAWLRDILCQKNMTLRQRSAPGVARILRAWAQLLQIAPYFRGSRKTVTCKLSFTTVAKQSPQPLSQDVSAATHERGSLLWKIVRKLSAYRPTGLIRGIYLWRMPVLWMHSLDRHRSHTIVQTLFGSFSGRDE